MGTRCEGFRLTETIGLTRRQCIELPRYSYICSNMSFNKSLPPFFVW